MQQSPLFSLIRAFAGAALLVSAAQAAELGDISVRSFIGQPLAADIELVSLAPDEVNALQVRLAQADVFRGANITMNPALASVRMSVVKRDQKQFLHVTTTRAIDADYVHLYVELSAAGRQDVRLATVWLQADPNPAPPVVAAPLAAAMTPAQAAQVAAQARVERERMAKEAAAASAASAASAAANAATAQAAALARERARPAPMPSAHESEVGGAGGWRAATSAPASAAPTSTTAAAPARRTPVSAAVRDLPERIAGVMVSPRAAPKNPPAKKEDAAAESAVPLTVAQALLPLPPLPLPKGIKRQEAPAACTPSAISAKECMALDTHNAALSSKLVELESKVKQLQGALAGSATGAAAAGNAGKPAAPANLAPAKMPAKASAAAAAHAVSAPALPAAAASTHAPAATAASAHAPAASAASAHTPAASGASARASTASASAVASAPAARAVQASASASGTASTAALAAQVETPTASASASSGSASASASASAAASAPVKLVRVLPKLKYKKEKPVERPTNYPALIAGGVGVLLLGAAGFIYLRKRKAGGAGPLKIWQGFRKKTPVDLAAASAAGASEAPSPRETATEPVA
jgi:pilus assembly protein FimV